MCKWRPRRASARVSSLYSEGRSVKERRGSFWLWPLRLSCFSSLECSTFLGGLFPPDFPQIASCVQGGYHFLGLNVAFWLENEQPVSICTCEVFQILDYNSSDDIWFMCVPFPFALSHAESPKAIVDFCWIRHWQRMRINGCRKCF